MQYNTHAKKGSQMVGADMLPLPSDKARAEKPISTLKQFKEAMIKNGFAWDENVVH